MSIAPNFRGRRRPGDTVYAGVAQVPVRITKIDSEAGAEETLSLRLEAAQSYITQLCAVHAI